MRARVADGVEIVVDANQRDAVSAHVEAPCRRGRQLVDCAQQNLLHGVSSPSLAVMAAANERAGRGDRQGVEHLVEEAGDDEALGP